MASQQVLFAETVASIKKALKRKAYESDSDESIDHNGNRGQKLKKRARFTRRGQLAPATTPQVYKEEIEYAGVKRRIIDRNPPLVDSEGFEVDSEDDDERVQAALANGADLNPYSSIHLERILAPLTSVTDLPSHPTLSMPFTAKTLTELSNQASELMRREHESLWKVRKLMTSLCGDFTWATCGSFVGPNDIDLYNDDNPPQGQRKKRPLIAEAGSSPVTNGDKNATVNGSSSAPTGTPADSTSDKAPGDEDVAMADGPNSDSRPPGGADEGKATAQTILDGLQKDAAPDKNPEPDASAAVEMSTRQQLGDTTKKTSADEDGKNGTVLQRTENKGEAQDAEQAGSHNAEMTGQDANGNLQHTDSSDDVFIHPFFNPPANRLPDRDMGLPASEAENVRHLMSLYMQKQEEICRGMAKLHQGLLKADRLRGAVFDWTKAEAHVGELSDGEDWYDREQWELSDDLCKGQDEEEEDNTTTQTTKKTRNRRA